MNLTKEYILNEAYKDANINDYQHYLDAFIEPIYRIIVENEVENEKIRSMINFNYCDNAIHLKKILSESVKLYTNETFKKSKSIYIIEMLNSINTLDFINQFYDSFELLYDKVIKYILKISGYYKSIYTELKKNRDKIKEIFQCDFDDLKNIKINLGDRHLYNIPTTLIQYKEHNFYYKDKDALYEDLFYNVFSYFDKDFTYEPSIKLSNGYLQKEIKMDNISNHPQMFRNAGKLIFIAYFLGTTDLHYENLILNNNFFKPIDCETIFDIDQYYCSEDKSVHYNLRNSVANTGLLPCKSINSFVVSGFSSYNVPLFDNDINIIFEKNKAISYTFNNSNEKTKKNKTLDFYNNIEDIIDGFECMYLKYLNSNKKKIHNSIINQFNGIKSRSLEKNTFDYYKILNESYHPYLVISNTRDNFFSNCKLTTHEVLQLLEDFIPVKHKEINLTEKYFDKFSLQDLQLQKCIIRECFIAERAFYNKKYQVVSSCKNNTFKEHLSDYISCLKNTSAIYNDNIIIFDFIIIGDNNKGYDFEVTIMPKEIYLGTSGVIHFLMNFTKYNDDEELSNMLNYLIMDLELYVEKTLNHDEISVGYFDGLSGILHILTKFYKFNGQKLIHIEKIIEYIYNNEIKKTKLDGDIINGSIGFIYFLLEYYKHTNNILIKEQIFNLTQKYIKSNPKNEYFGFAHGIAGEIFVLNQVRKILPDKNIDVFLESKLNKLLLNLDKKHYNWKISENSDTLPLNWCHGSPGILLIYPEFRDKYNWPINNILMKIVDNRSSNLCLCHGLIGNMWILNYINNLKYNNYQDKVYNMFFENFYVFDYNKSYMLGSSGILNTLLYSKYNSLFM